VITRTETGSRIREMSTSDETPSVDRYQPQPVVVRRHSQLKAPPDDEQRTATVSDVTSTAHGSDIIATGNTQATPDNDVGKSASDDVTAVTTASKPEADEKLTSSSGEEQRQNIATQHTSATVTSSETSTKGNEIQKPESTAPKSAETATKKKTEIKPDVVKESTSQQPSISVQETKENEIDKSETTATTTTAASSGETSTPKKKNKKKKSQEMIYEKTAATTNGENESEDSKPEPAATELPAATEEETAEAMKEIEKLRLLSRSLRAAVDESRRADGLDGVDDAQGPGRRAGHGTTTEETARKTSREHHEHDHDEDEHEIDLNAEPQSRARQSRSEKKARKALCKLGLKQVNGIAQVTIRRKKNVMFIINRPDVYVNSNSETYIVFGEARIEDPEERAKQEAARHFMESSDVTVRNLAKTAGSEDATKEHVSDDEKVDETGLSEKDIELVMSQAGVSRSRAVRALQHNDNDIVNAIMALTT
jgi:nascent polypeptide-associated complex subunit alpha